ncbi:MAG: hypothetical protein ACREKL_03210 [Chthoniobacterales bacterium]
MKTFKTLILGAAGIALAHTAGAQTVIYIAGSNGDRPATQSAIAATLVGETWAVGNNATPTKANFGTWTGGTLNGVPVTVKVSFIGATGAIEALAGNHTVKFLENAATGFAATNDPTSQTYAGTPDQHIPDFITSTNFVSTTPYSGTYQGTTYAALTDVKTGVLPLKFIASKGFATTGADNITTQQAYQLYSAGQIPLSTITGNFASHRHITVFAIGRNSDAGQRYIAQTEIGVGVNGVVKQYQPSITGASSAGIVGGYTVGGTVNSHQLWPVETWSGVNSNFLGNSGFNTGSALAPALTATLAAAAYQSYDAAATAGYYIGYVAESDANNIALGQGTSPGPGVASVNGGVELKYNGVQLTATNLNNGLYTLWGYVHIYRKAAAGSLTGDALSLYTALRDRLVTGVDFTSTSSGTPLTDLTVKRDGEGTPVYDKTF